MDSLLCGSVCFLYAVVSWSWCSAIYLCTYFSRTWGSAPSSAGSGLPIASCVPALPVPEVLFVSCTRSFRGPLIAGCRELKYFCTSDWSEWRDVLYHVHQGALRSARKVQVSLPTQLPCWQSVSILGWQYLPRHRWRIIINIQSYTWFFRDKYNFPRQIYLPRQI